MKTTNPGSTLTERKGQTGPHAGIVTLGSGIEASWQDAFCDTLPPSLLEADTSGEPAHRDAILHGSFPMTCDAVMYNHGTNPRTKNGATGYGEYDNPLFSYTIAGTPEFLKNGSTTDGRIVPRIGYGETVSGDRKLGKSSGSGSGWFQFQCMRCKYCAKSTCRDNVKNALSYMRYGAPAMAEKYKKAIAQSKASRA